MYLHGFFDEATTASVEYTRDMMSHPLRCSDGLNDDSSFASNPIIIGVPFFPPNKKSKRVLLGNLAFWA